MDGIEPGTIGLTVISGYVGKDIRVGQFLNGEGFARWEHAFGLLPSGEILEAEPGGARIVPLTYADVYWCKNLRKILGPVSPVLITVTAERLRGTPYSFLDYGSLFAHRLHLPVPGLRDYIKSTGHEICSQLVDTWYLRMNAHLFDDGRWEGDVTPASLYRRDLALA